MGKLTEAFVKLAGAKTKFLALVEQWQTAITEFNLEIKTYRAKLGELMARDDKVLDAIKDDKEKSKKNVELAEARGKALKDDYPSGKNADSLQESVFSAIPGFGGEIDAAAKVLDEYDTKGVAKKEQKRKLAKAALTEAKLELAKIKHCKVKYDYEGEGAAMFEDVKAAGAEIKRLSEKLQSKLSKLKEQAVAVET